MTARSSSICGIRIAALRDPRNLRFPLPRPTARRLNPPFEGDVIEAALSLQATTHTTAVFANYGVTDRWDIGLAVPFVRVNLDASVQARIIRLVTDRPGSGHLIRSKWATPMRPGPCNTPATRAGSATSCFEPSITFCATAGGGLAAAVDFRLPTGDENELLGAGGAQAKFLLVASSERGRFGQHVNIGYTAAQGDVAGTARRAHLHAASR